MADPRLGDPPRHLTAALAKCVHRDPLDQGNWRGEHIHSILASLPSPAGSG